MKVYKRCINSIVFSLFVIVLVLAQPTVTGAATLIAILVADTGSEDIGEGVSIDLSRMSALVEDLAQRELLRDTVVIWMGEFGRTPRINQNAGRDHFARAWSCVVGGGDLRGGIAVGETSSDGTAVETEPFSSEDLMTTVCKGLGISTDKTFTSKNGRPMKIAGGGKIISELMA